MKYVAQFTEQGIKNTFQTYFLYRRVIEEIDK